MNKIIYLDAAATSLKPDSVLSAEADFLKNGYANAGRGVCARATAVDVMVRNARACVAKFINANINQVVFTAGATDGLNRVVSLACVATGRDCPTVCVSDLDHHSARCPWENLAVHNGCNLVVVPLTDKNDIDVTRIPSADIMVITAMSNVLGVAQDVAEIVRMARRKNPQIITIVDAAQYIVHNKIDAIAWDADFIMFSGHKIGADTGLGVMYVRDADKIQPDKFGGGMVQTIEQNKIIYNDAPDKFEAGTLPLTQIAGLGAAIEYLCANRPDTSLIKYMYDKIVQNNKIKILTARDACVLAFVPSDMHVLDFGALMGANDVCLRVGNMCATWIHRRMGLAGSVRISVGPWNTRDEMDVVANIINSMVH